MHAFNLQKSTQKWRDPSFLHTSTTTLHHGDWLGQMAPTSSMSLRDVLPSSNKGGSICLNHSLKGSLSVMRISCSIALVQPSSLSSKAKASWKVKTSSLATAAFPVVQELKPSRFNFSRSFSCHAATKRGSGGASLPRAACTSRDNSVWGMGNADSMQAILVPFFK